MMMGSASKFEEARQELCKLSMFWPHFSAARVEKLLRSLPIREDLVQDQLDGLRLADLPDEVSDR